MYNHDKDIEEFVGHWAVIKLGMVIALLPLIVLSLPSIIKWLLS